MNEEAIDRLDLSPGVRILDIGFGGGVTFPLLLERDAIVVGIDRSADVVNAAERAHRESIESGRVEVRVGDVDEIPFESGSFTGVITVNTVYFWTDLETGLAEILRVLKPGGRAVIAIRDGSVMKRVDRGIFTVRTPGELLEAMEAAGFADARSDPTTDGARHYLSARKP